MKNNLMDKFNFNAIGFVRSGYKEKFGVPRQAGLVRSLVSEIEIVPPYAQVEAFREIDKFSHLWIIFVFHQCLDKEWRATVRPPRMGGNSRVGVFASRSPFRPNPIGLSAVELVEVIHKGDKTILRIKGGDLVDGSPILDIKPYVPYADKIPASEGYASRPEPSLQVEFQDQARAQIEDWEKQSGQTVLSGIKEILELDPRPAYRGSGADQASYGLRLYDLNVRFEVDGNRVIVTRVEHLD